ncbi:MAG: ATP-dependent DNA helicase RecG [Chloroflexi bacterium]|nr:ATP-dependent DNA helicase RecG [Chloroflexota bacterium]
MTTTTSTPAELLRQVLEMLARERETGYCNRVITGGLDKYLAVWLPKLADALPPDQREALGRFPLGTYQDTPLSERPQWIARLARWLREVAAPAPVPSTPPRAAPSRRAPAKPARPPVGNELDQPITRLPGIDRKLAVAFRRLGVETVRDLLFFFPSRHLDRRQVLPIRLLRPGEDATVQVVIRTVTERQLGAGRRLVEALVSDESGVLRAVWFNQPWMVRQLREGSVWLLTGRVEEFRGHLSLTVSEHEPFHGGELTHTGRLVPLYPLTQGLVQRTVRRLVKRAVDQYAARLPETLPAAIREAAQLIGRVAAVRALHYPASPEQLAAARRRLAFDELFMLQLGLQRAKREWQEAGQAEPICVSPEERERWVRALPFTLTAAQQRAVTEILADLARERPMARLLQGDVGSGKTVVAALALVAAVERGGQGALLAPTEILAQQHLASLQQLLTALRPGTRVELLTGAVTGRQRRQILEALAAGEVDVLVGTHALIQEPVTFRKLTLGVVDEQHRFGVVQRAALRQKGSADDRTPHILVMTATPIPRTLALTLYGDLDLSVLDELPPGRQPIVTKVLLREERERAYALVRDQVRQGRQAYVICPLIEESEKLDVRAATAEFERLQAVFPHLRLGLLHGRMKPKEKDAVMLAFRDGALDVLVSTAVVEVGIDVPNATVMVIEGAERFGLAQLHQFRGRVGRGSAKSYCLLLTDSEEASERLRIVERTADGFALAEEDLRLRGPGEFWGVRQSGLPELKVARLSDAALVEEARRATEQLFAADPTLSWPEHQLLRAELERVWVPGASGDRS